MYKLQGMLTVALLQVVLSYLKDQPPDIESCEAAFEAYFAQPLQPAVHELPQDSFQSQTFQLRTHIWQALAAFRAAGSSNFCSLFQKYPATQALEALHNVVSMIDSHLKQVGHAANTDPPAVLAAQASPGASMLATGMR